MVRLVAFAGALGLACAFTARAAVSEEGVASWYGGRHHGGPTASGERFDQYALTAAHPTLPVRAGVRLRVTRLDTGATIVVRINDRGPAKWTGRVIDLSRGAAAYERAPMAIEAVKRIDALFEIEREINGLAPEKRLEIRAARSRPLAADLETWLRANRVRLSSKSAMANAIDYMLKRWPAFTRFLDDGRICMSNNAAERAVRGIAVGRRNWTFAGSDAGGRRAAAMYTLIETAELNDVDPRAWLADVLARLPDYPARRLDEMLPWNWKPKQDQQVAA